MGIRLNPFAIANWNLVARIEDSTIVTEQGGSVAITHYPRAVEPTVAEPEQPAP